MVLATGKRLSILIWQYLRSTGLRRRISASGLAALDEKPATEQISAEENSTAFRQESGRQAFESRGRKKRLRQLWSRSVDPMLIRRLGCGMLCRYGTTYVTPSQRHRNQREGDVTHVRAESGNQ
jgi:hypothetical protein